MTPYPPQPWRLHASACVSFWRVPTGLVSGIPSLATRRVGLFGSAWLCSGFVEYQPPGDLTYRECFLAALAKIGGRWGATLPLIWVDSEPAMRGGVELWAIPKQIATVQCQALRYVARTAETGIAELLVRRMGRLSLPFWARANILQERNQALLRTPMRITAKMQFAQVAWSIPENSPFACLRGRQPWFSCLLTNAALRVGA